MRCMFLRWTCGMAVGLGLMGCGVEDPTAPVQGELQGEVEQSVYNAVCETDAAGYQTGACLEFVPLSQFCAFVPYTSGTAYCDPTLRHPGTPTSMCGTYINSNFCRDGITVRPR
ncbi:hypothetical protein HUW62_08990 [Myxococcus sp. AM011]|uniref:hypothetical protein n=1 Tax=Myxococcus sp. AM011 TaxID=2745200 RepID=UPI00159615DC|nr:hypothetical protein [Myxococcus sp. AM011]NVJ21351.1 hypothetical protein [Myxococcus sp. AM011]